MGQDVDLDLVLIERFEKNRNCKMHVPYTFLKRVKGEIEKQLHLVTFANN